MPDAQGRLTIPPVLRRYANLTSGISLVARGDKMELWDTEIWQQYLAEKLTTDKVRSALKLMDSRDNGINN
jgi:DNA-binding transcriptional regulator/RsmH inhibitor MraZ